MLPLACGLPAIYYIALPIIHILRGIGLGQSGMTLSNSSFCSDALLHRSTTHLLHATIASCQ